eukprot:CAMPEP_0171446656 /NCGR_PEP_ID=MMETSP0881-20121228/38707_1 /TAXON_ID=67004 /ORGANISM="Thalassiosira weissflogii, Strain CCMP1336" /LENGTH=73 /DNA_ID=CAMNT_0011971049 /DNA_START=886 /DNA_END=1104 /DNA_ORIENTATION=+
MTIFVKTMGYGMVVSIFNNQALDIEISTTSNIEMGSYQTEIKPPTGLSSHLGMNPRKYDNDSSPEPQAALVGW